MKHQDFLNNLLKKDYLSRPLNEISLKKRDEFIKDLENHNIETEEITNCLCGENTLLQLSYIDRFNLNFGSYLCPSCGLILTSPRIKQKFLPAYYDKYYHPLHFGKKDLKDQTALYKLGQGKKIFELTSKHFPKEKQHLKILEIGAGTGNVLDEFSKEAKNNQMNITLCGTEYSQECIKSSEKKGIKMISGGVQEISNVTTDPFDLIILSHVFEHFIDLENELNMLKKIMHDDTLLYIEVPGLFTIHKRPYYDFSYLGHLTHAHIYNFTLDSLLHILVNNGFNMLYGNEEVESIFKLGKSNQKATNPNPLIYFYLDFLYQNHDYFKSSFETLKQTTASSEHLSKRSTYLEQQIIKFETQVINRNKDIVKLSDQVKNRNKDILKLSDQVENRNKDIIKLKLQIENRNIDIQRLTKQKDHKINQLQTENSHHQTLKQNIISSFHIYKNSNFFKHPFNKIKALKKLFDSIRKLDE
jgi:ubiquinone/menaquinone biosynthesis C-methylase UbiE